jgi:hypothetical protein
MTKFATIPAFDQGNQLLQTLNAGFASMNARLDGIEAGFASFNARLDGIENRLRNTYVLYDFY